MLVVFFRALILFAFVFLVIRLMGKRELSKVQPFELAIIVMIYPQFFIGCSAISP